MNQRYTSDFFDSHREGARRSAGVVIPLLLKLVPAQSVVDVGCGQGTWLSVFRERGIEDIYGIDGDYIDREKLEIPSDHFCPRDLSRPLRMGRTFDLAVSLEVAEHLPGEAAEVFVESLTRLAPAILFSAAAPYQGGTHHVNEQWPAYWAERFGRRGYLPVDCLRRRLWENPQVDWWYAQNAFLYVDQCLLEANLALKQEYETAGPGALPLVHPRRFLEWVEWGLGLCGEEPSTAAWNGVAH
jgi:SAM-dependent methyltransferase